MASSERVSPSATASSQPYLNNCNAWAFYLDRVSVGCRSISPILRFRTTETVAGCAPGTARLGQGTPGELRTHPPGLSRPGAAATRTYKTESGQYCREYQQTITVGGKTEQGYGRACRQPDGSWRIVDS